MGLKKSYFKGLQNGVNSSPIRQDGVGVDKKFPNIVNQVANDNLVNNRSIIKPNQSLIDQKIKKDFLANEETENRTAVNQEYRDYRLNELKKAYPNANDQDLKNYLFSDKPGIAPENMVGIDGYLGIQDRLSEPGLPSDALAQSQNYVYYDNGVQLGKPERYDIRDTKDASNDMYNLNLNEKTKLLENKINNLNLDPKKRNENYQLTSLNNFKNWYTDPTTQQRLLEQAQKSGNLGTKGMENVAGSLYSQADIDSALTGIADYQWNFEKSGNGSIGSIDPGDRVKQNIRSRTQEEIRGGYGDITQNNQISIDPSVMYNGVNIDDPRQSNIRDNTRNAVATSNVRANQQAGFHELTHITDFDKAMDPYLRNILEKGDRAQTGGMGDTQFSYNRKKGELYANFVEFRNSINMKPGEQFDSKKLNERIKEYGMERDDFRKNWKEESLIEALNTVAKADKTTPGKTKFDDLQMMQGNMNTEVA